MVSKREKCLFCERYKILNEAGYCLLCSEKDVEFAVENLKSHPLFKKIE